MSGAVTGRSAVALPWLCPAADALLTLTDAAPLARTLSGDIAFCAHVARFLRPSLTPTCRPFDALTLTQPSLAAAAATLLESTIGKAPLAAINLPTALHEAVERAVALAGLLATETPGVSPGVAALATRLAYLGWVAAVAVNPASVAACLADADHRLDPLETQRRHFGLDCPAVTRRLAARWRFPDWLTALLGSLRLPAADAARLGAPLELFHVVRAAIAVVEQTGTPLGLVEPGTADDIAPQELFLLAAKLVARVPTPAAFHPAPPPTPVALFVRLLRTSALARRSQAAVWLAAAEDRVDQLTQLLTELRGEFDYELRDAKLAGLAEFAAGAGHEINNPLAIISGNAQLLLGKAADPDSRKSLLTIVRQTKRIHDILQGTRHFARPPQPSPETVELARWLPGVLSSLQGEAEQKGLSLTTDLHGLDRSLTIEADPQHLRQALGHLVQNAIDAAPKGGWVRVGVQVYPRAVRLTVDDNGPGPTAEHVEHLFDPFFSGRSAGRGRGIGLSIAWRLAQLNGGDVRYTPRSDGATRFTLTVPHAGTLTAPQPTPARKSA